MVRVMQWVLGAVVAAMLLLYGGDWLLLRHKLSQHQGYGVVEVHHSYAVSEKGGKTEFIPLNTENQTCVHSVFPHGGYSPCWYVRRHSDQYTEV